MPKESIFQDEWRECMRAHYMDVCHRDDQRTLRSLLRVMVDIGFTDDELAEMRVRATMRADEMPADFVPEMPLFQVGFDGSADTESVPQQAEAEPDFAPSEELEEIVDAELPLEGDEKDPDEPEQLSLF